MADETLNANDGTLNVRAGSLGGTSMRYHELALQRWLNQLFYVREGYPVPVVFTSPMDAFSYFQQLWSDDTNPFAYLFGLKDASGTPLYEPHPSPVRYPVISVYRKGWKYRQYQNFSIHRFRHINWPTVANAGTERYGPQAQGWNVTKCQLGNVTTSRMPMAWDYKFQIDHFCNRPDTQAFFVEQLMQEFWRTGGTVPQTWISVPYPGWGNRRVRLYLDGDPECLTPEEPEEGKNVEYRTSFTVVVEGFDVDLRYEIYPALWNIVFRFGPVAPIELEDCFNLSKTVDVRLDGSNTTLDRRLNVPTWGTCQSVIEDIGDNQSVIEVVGLNSAANNSFGVFTIGTEMPVLSISGTVSQYGTALAGVGIAIDNIGTVYTDSNGSYGVDVLLDYTGNSQPVSGGTFTPPFYAYVLLKTTQTHQDFALVGGAVVATGTESVQTGNTFVYGSNDLYVYHLSSQVAASFVSGTLLDASVSPVVPVQHGTVAVSLLGGTLSDAILHSSGTQFGTVATTFLSGTLFDAIDSTGTLTSGGSVSVGLYSGSLILLIIGAGTHVEQTSITVGLHGGALA